MSVKSVTLDMEAYILLSSEKTLNEVEKIVVDRKKSIRAIPEF